MKTPSPRPDRWSVPYRRNPFFTGREDILQHLHHALHAESAVALSHPQSISGLGGIGKTQTALEYAYRYREDYNAVFWMQADSAAALTAGYAKLADLLQLPERDEQDQRVMIEAVLRWLRMHPGWLLVFDGMDDPSMAEPLLPKAGPGHILFTTRAHALGTLAQRVEVRQMEPETGALLLLRRASLLDLQETLSKANPDDQILACAISEELGGLPLALDQAGAYIKETSCLLKDYLDLYRARWRELLSLRGSSTQDYPASVATTWSLSFEKISQANPAAAELLNFCAYLSPEAIPEEILTAGAPYLGDVLGPAVINPRQLDLACKEVLRFSLVRREVDVHALTMHRLVQVMVRDNLPADAQQRWMRSAVYAVDAAFPQSPDTGVVRRSEFEHLLPHALTCAIWIEQAQLATLLATRLLLWAGSYLRERARYGEAEPLLVRALAISEQELGATHPDMAGSLSNLAALYKDQGKYGEAEPLFVRALAINEQALGPDHLITANSLSNLAALYKDQGKYGEIEPLYQRALAIFKQQLGATHPLTAMILNSLAILYRIQGKYAEAEPLYQRALAISEQELGATHPDMLSGLNSLAGFYLSQRKYAEAEPLYQRALAICEQTWGAEHPVTATTLNNLALLYSNQEKYTEAEPLYQRALAICEQVLGPDHPVTANSLNNLAGFYRDQGKNAEAEPLLQRALAINEQALGPDHPATALSLNNLAGLYRVQGKYTKAEPLLQRVLSLQEQHLEFAFPDAAYNLAVLYQDQGLYTKAEPLYRRALAISEQQLGPAHPDTAQILSNLVQLYMTQSKYKEVRSLLESTLFKCEHALGRTHLWTRTIRQQYDFFSRQMDHRR